jgi:AraC-like DNA-binding protein
MSLTFNAYSTLLALGFIQGAVYALLLWVRGIRNERSSDILLGWLLVAACVEILPYTLGFLGINILWERLFFFPHSMGMLIGPLFYFYFIVQTNSEFRFSRKHILHLAPFLLVAGYHLIIWLMGKDFVMAWDAEVHRGYHINTLEEVGYFISNITYFMLALKLYTAYRKWTPTMFSDPDSISFSWYRNFLISIGLAIAFSWLMRVVDSYWNLPYQQDWWDKVFVIFIIYYISISGYSQSQRQRIVYAGINRELAKPIITLADDHLLNNKLQTSMQDQKLYRKSDLSLHELAGLLDCTASKLSAHINTAHQKNFNDFINSYRVQEVKQMLEAGKHKTLSLLGIGLDAGFNSKATFNRVFKKLTGMTPNEYVKGNGRNASSSTRDDA